MEAGLSIHIPVDTHVFSWLRLRAMRVIAHFRTSLGALAYIAFRKEPVANGFNGFE